MALDRSSTLISVLSLLTERLSGVEVLVISWQRTPSPGSTGKRGRNRLQALRSGQVCVWVGEGFPSGFKCDEKLLPSTGPVPGTALELPPKQGTWIHKQGQFVSGNNCFCFTTTQALKTGLLNSTLVV